MCGIWISHHSIDPWSDPNCWAGYLSAIQDAFGKPLTHLDSKDPVRRKSRSLEDAGHYICSFDSKANSRWVFGKIGYLGIHLTINIHRDSVQEFSNVVTWHVPSNFFTIPEAYDIVRKVFSIGNDLLIPFYSFSDCSSAISKMKIPRRTVNIQEELLGMFWITYFNGAYVSFFGKQKIDSISGIRYTKSGGVEVLLGATPKAIPAGARERSIGVLGKDSFFNPQLEIRKRPGQFALTFAQLDPDR